MIRTQIQITAEQHGKLRALAAERGVSMSALVREGVEHVLRRTGRDRLWELLWEVLGKHHDASGARDVSERHDDYLAEAYGRGSGAD